MSSLSARVLVLAGLLSATGQIAVAQQPVVKVKEEKPGLLAQAKITPDSATKVAQARLPNGKIKSAEIEMEEGHLLYSFDMVVAGQPGIEEVQVDAKTGKVLGVEHEDAEAEAKEKAKEKEKEAPVKP